MTAKRVDLAEIETAATIIADMIAADELELPPYPAVAHEIQATIQSGAYSNSDLARLVGTDQVVCAAILRHASSARYAGMGEVKSIERAIAIIGERDLVRVMMALSVAAVAAGEGPLADVRRLVVRQGLASGILCEFLAPLRGADPAEAFLCGLLHDFGRALMLSALETLVRRGSAASQQPTEHWLELIHRKHVEVGLRLAVEWNLSQQVLDCVAHHHEDDTGSIKALDSASRDLLGIVTATDHIIRLMESHSAVTSELLLQSEYIASAAEAAAVEAFIPTVPYLVEAFDLKRPGRDKRDEVEETLVADPPVPAPPPGRPVSFVVELIRATRREKPMFQSVAVDGDMLFVEGTFAPVPNKLVQVVLHLDTGPFEVWVTVVRCDERGAGVAAELRLFAADRPTKRRWEQLGVQTAEAPALEPAMTGEAPATERAPALTEPPLAPALVNRHRSPEPTGERTGKRKSSLSRLFSAWGERAGARDAPPRTGGGGGGVAAAGGA